jgi:predicted dinucleotide-binding enzyme
MVCVTIIGTGDLAHGLAHLFFVNNNNNGNSAVANDHYVQQSHQLLVTKPGLRPGGAGSTNTFHETAVPLVDMNEGIARADVIVLAIPASALRLFLSEYQDRLQEGNKIVVDATNSPRRGQDVISILTKSSSSPPNSTTTTIQSVKAFHDIGAVEALLDKPANKRKIPVQMCSNYPDALAVVRAFAEESLGLDVKVIPYQHYGQIAQVQYRLDESWITAIVIMLLLFVVTETYAIFRSVTSAFP